MSLVTVGLLLVVLCRGSSGHANASLLLDSMETPLVAGTTQRIVCRLPDPMFAVSYTWLKNGAPVINSTRVVETTTQNMMSVLEFNPLYTSDGGQYQCIVSTGRMESELFITLNVTSE